MDGIWAVVVVAGFAFALAFAVLLLMARTTWTAMRYRSNLDEIQASMPPPETPMRPHQLHRTPLAGMAPPRFPDGEYAGGIPLMPDDDESEG